MILDRISILNYKNILQAELDFSPKINCFVGNNGEGKTNILDAIYYLSFCKSNSNSIDNQNINHDSEFFSLQGNYHRNNGQEENIYCALKRRTKKVFKHNKKEYERLADHIGKFPLVLITPNDNSLIGDGSEERRKFMDGVISQYNQTPQQRNSLLKEDSCSDDLLDVFDSILDQEGRFIHAERQNFID